MADSYGALIKTTTVSTGTLDYVLATTALTTAHRTPKQAVADGSLTDGDIVQYMVRDTTVTGDASFELGEGIYTDATNEIARDAANIHDGSNGPGVLVTWPGSGQRDVYLVVSPSVKTARLDRANIFTEVQNIVGAPPKLELENSSTGDKWDLEVDAFTNLIIRDVTNSSNVVVIRGQSATTEKIRVDADGKVGFGISVPVTNVHIQESNTDTVPAVEIEQLSTGDAALQFSIVGDAFAIGIDNTDDKFKISYAGAAGAAVLGTNDRFAITPGGSFEFSLDVAASKVHIFENLTSISQMVEIEQLGTGDANLSFSIVGDSYAMGIDNTDDSFKISYGAGAGLASLGTNDRFIIDPTGNIGFGKTPNSKIDISLATEDLEIVDAGSVSATQQDWIEVEVNGVQGYIHVFAAK